MSEINPEEIEGPRAATQMELGGALDLANLVLRTLGTPPGEPQRRPTIGSDYPHVFNPANLENLRVCVHRGRVVCGVSIYPGTVVTPRGPIRVGGINALVTQPEYRRLGLATRIMEDAHNRMREAGLHVAQLSTKIHDYYRKLGWETAGRQRSYGVDRGNVDLLGGNAETSGHAVREDWKNWLPDLARLHAAEPLHADRSAESFRLLLHCKADTALVHVQDQTASAYVVLRGASVVEHAGPLALVLELLGAAFARLDNPGAATSERVPGQRATVEMSVLTVADSPLARHLDSLGLPGEMAYQGLMKLLDPVGMLAGLSGELPTITALDSGRYSVSLRSLKAELSERELVRLLFGPERHGVLGAALQPLDYMLWPLERV